MGCCEPRCPMNYHFMCARNAKAEFQDDKKVYCAQHSFRTKKEVSRFFLLPKHVSLSSNSVKPVRHAQGDQSWPAACQFPTRITLEFHLGNFME